MQKKPIRFFALFFIQRQTEGGINIERIQLFDAGTAPRDRKNVCRGGKELLTLPPVRKEALLPSMKNGSAGYMGEFDGYARPKYSAEIAQATAQENLRRRGNRRGANCRKHEGRFNMSGTTVKWAIGDCDSTDKTTSFAPVPSCASLCTHRLSFPELQGGLRIGGWTI